MCGKNSGPFFKFLRSAVNRTLALGIEHQALALLQSKGAGAHRGDQVRVRVHGHQTEGPSQEIQETLAEDLAGADVKHVFEETPGNLAGDDRTIEKALMVRGEDKRTFLGQLLLAAHAQPVEDAHEQRHQAAKEEPAKASRRLLLSAASTRGSSGSVAKTASQPGREGRAPGLLPRACKMASTSSRTV